MRAHYGPAQYETLCVSVCEGLSYTALRVCFREVPKEILIHVSTKDNYMALT